MEQTQCNYEGYGTVTVIAVEGALSQIRTSNEDEFWVKSAKLKPVKNSQLKARPARVTLPANEKEVRKYACDTLYGPLVNYLNEVGYKLTVDTRTDGIDQCRDEYRKWGGGELQDSCIKVYENRPYHTREWRLFFPFYERFTYPFPIIEMGQGGGKGKACGLVRGGIVTVYYAELIEGLIRAGLQARID